MAHEHATIAEEEYLQTIYWLMEAGLPITGANIARAMQLSPPTVHEMLGPARAGRLRHARGRQVAALQPPTAASRPRRSSAATA